MTQDVKRHASTCKYARPTLLQPAPQWLHAEDAPWTCVRTTEPRPLADTGVCDDCPFWEAVPDAKPSAG